jgi:hypothetical protein
MFFSILLSWIYFSGLVALIVLRMLVIFSFMFVFLDICICLYYFCVLLLCSVFYVLVFSFVFSLLKSMLILLIILLLIASLMIPHCLLGLMMLSSWGTIIWVPSQRGQGLLSFFSFFLVF